MWRSRIRFASDGETTPSGIARSEDPAGPSPGLLDRCERPREGDVHVAGYVLDPTGDHGGVRQTQILHRELEERRPLGAALNQQDPDTRERDSDHHARQPGPRTEVGGLVDALDDRDRSEAVQGVAFPYPARVRSRDRPERDRSVDEELLEPEQSGDLRWAEEHPEVTRLC